mgnify:CR=1 FL=1
MARISSVNAGVVAPGSSRARLAPGEHLAHPDGEEVTDALVLSRAELDDALGTGAVVLPGPTSIARMLIEDWYGGPIVS